MNEDNIFREKGIVSKVLLGIIGAYIGFLSLIFISFFIVFIWYSIFSSSPNKTESKRLSRVISSYHLPKSSKLVFSRRKGLLLHKMCFVFSYPKGHFSIPNNQYQYNYSNQNINHDNKEFLHKFNREMSKVEGCEKFFAKFKNEDPTLFIEHDYHYEYGRGSKIFVNQRNNLIMFEGYYYD